MKTLDEVRDRCIIVPADDSDDGAEHWLFQGASTQTGYMRICAPDFTLDSTGQTLTTQSARRAVRHLATGKPIPRGWRVWSRCQVRGCVHPACVGAGNQAAYGRARAKSGADKGKLGRILANRRTGARHCKVTPHMAQEFMRSAETSVALGLRYGISRTTVQRVRRGQTRLAGNPFQGLLA